MKSWLFLFVFCGLTIKGCFSEELKKENFPYMAFLYYHDSTIKNRLYENKRFIQNAILIKPEFLLTASIIEPTLAGNGFPHKTLLARIGAITIDETLQYNEDENEQEREIVQVIRPFHYNHHLWWKSDISVLKSVTPFNVKFISFPILYGHIGTECTTLAYVKNNTTMERQLTSFDIRIQPNKQCGPDFYDTTMVCGEYIYDLPPPDFCEGNSGGPLMCSDRLVGLQTFINNECKSPFLFQLLVKWQKFITCSISQTCHEDECSTTCLVTYKDIVENSKENQVLPKSEEIKETLNVIPADVTESIDAEITRTSTQSLDSLKSSTPMPIITVTDGLRNTIDNSEITDKENEDNTVDLPSTTVTTTALDMADRDDSSENKNDRDNVSNNLSLDMSKLNEIEESAIKDNKKSDEIIEKKDENLSKPDDKMDDGPEDKMTEDKATEDKTIEKNLKIEEADESAEADKSEDGSGRTYDSVTKSLTKISLEEETILTTTTTLKNDPITTTIAPIPTPLSADKVLKTGDKTGTDIDTGGEKADVSHESGEGVPEINSKEASKEASREVSSEKRIDGSGKSVISVESVTTGDKSVEKKSDTPTEGSEERSSEKNIEKPRKSGDGIDLPGDIAAEASREKSVEKSDEKIERRDHSESVEDVEARRRVVSGKLSPPTVSDEAPKSTTTTAATTTPSVEQVGAKEDKSVLRAYSHGTKSSYETGLITSVFFRYLFCFYF